MFGINLLMIYYKILHSLINLTSKQPKLEPA